MKRALFLIPHFFGSHAASDFIGGSTHLSNRSERESTVHLCIRAARESVEASNLIATIQVVGLANSSLVHIDRDVSFHVNDPRHIVYATADLLLESIPNYDYFFLMEDDILITRQLVEQLVQLQSNLGLTDIVIPNRMENIFASSVCSDLLASYAPYFETSMVTDLILGRSKATHSGFFFASRQQLVEVAHLFDLQRSIRVGNYMASAFNALMEPFNVWREVSWRGHLTCQHMDSWIERAVLTEGPLTRSKVFLKWFLCGKQMRRIGDTYMSNNLIAEGKLHERTALSALVPHRRGKFWR